MSNQLPQFLRDLIACPPMAGSGIHGWLFKVSRQLHPHRTREEIIELLTAATEGCGRPVPAREIIGAVDDAQKCAYELKPRARLAPPTAPGKKWPAINTKLRASIIAGSERGVADLYDSPGPGAWRCDDLTAEQAIDNLFPGDPLLCMATDNSHFATLPREAWRGEEDKHALIVPSPMIAPTGETKDGRTSAHTLANTGPRKFLVTEFDAGTLDQQVRLIEHLADWGECCLVVHSGGKSLHAWWFVEGGPEETSLRFMRYAASLGADPATWTRSQFVRLPGGWREDKQAKQEILYFHPIPQ